MTAEKCSLVHWMQMEMGTLLAITTTQNILIATTLQQVCTQVPLKTVTELTTIVMGWLIPMWLCSHCFLHNMVSVLVETRHANLVPGYLTTRWYRGMRLWKLHVTERTMTAITRWMNLWLHLQQITLKVFAQMLPKYAVVHQDGLNLTTLWLQTTKTLSSVATCWTTIAMASWTTLLSNQMQPIN